jgi:RecA-family ATPase
MAPSITLTRLGDLLNEPETTVEWLVEELFPSGGFSLLVAKPKVGKSTLARQLALSIARGDPFIGRWTTQGAVIYLALEEKRSEVRKHFRDMGATGEEEIYIFASAAPIDALAQIRAVAEERKPALLIIGPLFRFTRVRDGNDYAQVTQALGHSSCWRVRPARMCSVSTMKARVIAKAAMPS